MDISVKVIPRASKTEIAEQTKNFLKIRLKAAPEKGKANQAVIAALSGYLGVARTRLSVSSGHASRNKVVEVDA